MARRSSMESGEKDTQVSKNAERHYISIDTTDAEVVEWNGNGDTLYFVDDPEVFKPLTEEVFNELSSMNKTKYTLAKETSERLKRRDPEMDEVSKRIQVGATQLSQGPLASRYFGNKPRKGLVSRVARADNVAYWEGKGYRVAKEGDLAVAKMPKQDGHYGIASQGVTTNVVMVTDDKTAAENRARRDALNEANLGKTTEGEIMARGTGYRVIPERD